MSSGILAGRGAIVTGASTGLGYAIASAYVEAGASVMICARDAAELAQARDRLAGLAVAGQVVVAQPADVSNEADVARLLEASLASLSGLDILVNNAGIVGPIGPFETVDWEAWKRTVDINLFGSALTCRAVIPHLRRRGGGKILQLSAGGATSPDPRFSAYAASKAGIVAFVATLAEELRGDAIDVNSIAPGGLNTRMNDEKLAAGSENLGDPVYRQLEQRRRDGGTPLSCGAELAVFLASSASDGITGKLISAVWDDWRRFPERLEALMSSDIYTLRRIVPKDRGLDWPAG